MPRVEFDVQNKKATTNYDYPKLKLKNGETARILLLEAPVVEYVHTLRAPKIVNGKPVMIKVERRGNQVDDYDKDFLSRPLCLGDLGVLDEKGSDEKHCPMCALAKTSPDMVQAPQRRYAMHVIRYKTKGNGTQLVKPFSVEVVVWSFTDTTFNKIADFKDEWGDLRKHDLILGPCTNETFQKADLAVGATAAWLESDDQKRLTAETFKENQIPDLSIAIGTKKELRWINEDLDTIKSRWKEATGVDSAAPVEQASLSAGLDDLMNGINDVKVDDPNAGATVSDDDLSSLLADADPITPSTATEDIVERQEPDVPAEAKAPAKTPAADPDDFESLLADLD